MRADAEANRESVIAAARRLMATASMDEVSMRAIAAEAGVGIGTLYRHFPTKIDLVEGIVDSALRTAVAALDGADDAWADDPEAAWAGAVRTLAAQRLGVVFADLADSTDVEEVFDRTADAREGLIAAITRDLDRAGAAGLVPAGLDPIRFHLGLVAATRPLPPRAVALAPDHADWMCEVYLAGLRALAG